MTERDGMPLVATGAGRPSVPGHGSADVRSAPGRSVHHVRTPGGAVSLSWDPDLGVFVAGRGQQTWSDGRLGALARTAGISIPAPVARELWSAQRLHPAMRVHGRPSVTQAPSRQVNVAADLSAPAGQAEQPPRAEATLAEVPPGDADARHDLIDNLGSVMHGLAGGEPVDQVLSRLRALVERAGATVEVERPPAVGPVRQADPQAPQTNAASAPLDRLHALRSRPAPSAHAVGRS